MKSICSFVIICFILAVISRVEAKISDNGNRDVLKAQQYICAYCSRINEPNDNPPLGIVGRSLEEWRENHRRGNLEKAMALLKNSPYRNTANTIKLREFANLIHQSAACCQTTFYDSVRLSKPLDHAVMPYDCLKQPPPYTFYPANQPTISTAVHSLKSRLSSHPSLTSLRSRYSNGT